MCASISIAILKHYSLQDELHHWSRFASRGSLAMANGGPDDDRSKFFYTLGRCDELSKKNAIFGKVRSTKCCICPSRMLCQ